MTKEFVFGKFPVLDCLSAGRRRAHRLYLLENARGMDDIREAAKGLPVDSCTRRELDAIAKGGVHQGVVLEANPIPIFTVEECLNRNPSKDSLVVILDGVEDPHNFGAIVRSAAAFGATCVVFAKDRSAPISPVSIKSAAGGMEHIDLVRVTNLVRAIEQLKENGFWIAALDPDSDQVLWKADLTGRTALVIGNEGKGIRRLVLEKCDHRLSIPLPGLIASLNASVSAGIALAECLRQRHTS